MRRIVTPPPVEDSRSSSLQRKVVDEQVSNRWRDELRESSTEGGVTCARLVAGQKTPFLPLYFWPLYGMFAALSAAVRKDVFARTRVRPSLRAVGKTCRIKYEL